MMKRLLLLMSIIVSLQANTTSNKPCPASQACTSGIVIPVWEPQINITTTTKIFRALVYFLSLSYLFFGVSIVTERFMTAIEVITSQKREVKLRKVTGEEYVIPVKIWNQTVSNLTLMALGSSAPEILLSVIEIMGNNFEAGELGPSTIVGSAAFNLFVIIAVCVFVVPSSETRKVKDNVVFWVTVIWSTFAYIWLYIIISVLSPGVIEVWEGILTFLYFPLTVFTAYVADKWKKGFGKRRLGIEKRIFLNDSIVNDRKEQIKLENEANNNNELRKSTPQRLNHEMLSHVAKHQRYANIFRKLRAKNPDASIVRLEEMALEKIFAEKPKSKAFYRIITTRRTIGGAITIGKNLKTKERIPKTTAVVGKAKAITVGFDPAYYVCMENVGTIKLRVRCDRSGCEKLTVVSVAYKTVADTAEENSDFIPISGALLFLPEEEMKEIVVEIVDNDLYEKDEHFYVILENVKAHEFGNQSNQFPASIGISKATVVIIDDDHAGVFGFSSDIYTVMESSGIFVAEIKRTRGARGEVSVPYNTIDGTAKANVDYIGVEGIAYFKNEQTVAKIEIEIINDDEYEKREDFYLQLGEPIWHDKTKDIKNDPGRPVLSSHSRCKIVITEDQEFASLIDRVVSNASTTLLVGTNSWKQQFWDALQIYDDKNESYSLIETFLRTLALPWKLLFSIIPPTDYMKGWISFFVAILMIALLTAVIGDLAAHFGCTIGLSNSVTAITLVALGTSVPDTFASRTAAVQDRDADSSIVNVTGSNAVNVFLGIGIAWAIATVYHSVHGTVFRVEAGNLAFSVTMFLIGSIICIAVLQFRHFSTVINGELGGPKTPKILSMLLFIGVWIAYVTLSILEVYCIIHGF